MRRVLAIAIGTLAGIAVAIWLSGVIADVWRGAGPASPDPERSASAPREDGRTIKATLFYVAEDGFRLVGVEREVPYGNSHTEQARHIIEAQLGLAPEPFVSALPEGTSLRALFMTEDGSAFVDLSREIVEHHTGGSLDELFTVYAIVNALATNLPAISAVQILVDGREVETLAGHIDLRHPLAQSLKWVRSDGSI